MDRPLDAATDCNSDCFPDWTPLATMRLTDTDLDRSLVATNASINGEPEDQRSTFIVRDPVHDYFVLPVELNPIVRQWAVQRLRRIVQTSTATSQFPSLTGTRFEHSLGTMHLARVAWREIWGRLDEQSRERLRVDVLTDLQDSFGAADEDIEDEGDRALPLDEHTRVWISDEHKFRNRFYHEMDVAIAAGALLHDLGHPPYSHALESFFERNAAILTGDPDAYRRLRDSASLSDPLFQFHEVAGLHLAATLQQEAYRYVSQHLVLRILRGSQPRVWVSAIHNIISGEVDVDRLDYLMRDANRAGTEFGAIDASRLFQAIELHPAPAPSGKGSLSGWQLGFGYRGRSAIETFLTNRIRYYQWVLFHFRVVASNKFLEEALEELLVLEEDRETKDSVAKAVRSYFKMIRPDLGYFLVSSNLDYELPIVDESGDKTVLLTLRDDAGPKIAAEVDDVTIVSWLRAAEQFSRAIRRDGKQPSISGALRRFSALYDAVLFREENWVSLWEDEAEYSEVATSLRAPLLKLLRNAESQLELRNEHFVAANNLGAVTRTSTDLVELVKIRRAIEFDASTGLNVLAQRLLWTVSDGTAYGRRQAELSLRRALSAESASIDDYQPNWIVSYQATNAVRTGENAVSIFKGSSTLPITQSSRMAGKLNSIAESYPRLFVFLMVPTSTKDPHESMSMARLRGIFIRGWLQWVGRHLDDVVDGTEGKFVN